MHGRSRPDGTPVRPGSGVGAGTIPRALIVAVTLALAGPLLAIDFAVPAHPADVILGRPTRDSITVSVMTYEDGDGYVEYGETGSAISTATPVKPLTERKAVEFVLDGLTPDTSFTYRLLRRPRGAESYTATPPVSFHTARDPGSAFTFAIQADSHLDANTSPPLYARTLANIAADAPDFLVDLGDTFMTDKYRPFTDAMPQYYAQRWYLGIPAASVPLFLTLGNHDGEAGWDADGTPASMPVWAAQLRTQLFPNPLPDSFYSGNTTPDPEAGPLQNYYAFTWGDALIVVLDPYRETRARSDGTDNWNWTLGAAQYLWLRDALESSRAPLKFVFIHHLVGGISGASRGGAEAAGLWEWGGSNADGSPGFAARRPGWPEPLHALFVRTGVSAVFHGHDHLYVKQDLDGIVYQEVPQPGFPRPGSTASAPEYGYTSGVVLDSSGHLRVHVAKGAATVEYVRAVLPQDETPARRNGDVVHAYEIAGRTAQHPARRRAVRSDGGM